MTIALHWQLNPLATYYHAAVAVYRGLPVDERAEAALAEPVAMLRDALQEERVPVERFLDVVRFFAIEFPTSQALAEVALRKTIGAMEANPPRVRRFTRALQAIRQSAAETLPAFDDALETSFRSLQHDWERIGPGILGSAVPWTDPDLLVGQATVLGLQRVVGGMGSANLAGNRVAIEILESDVAPPLPEVVRLAWLLSQLNLDLPRFSDEITPARRERVIALAMVPVVLTAAQTAGACAEPPNLENALRLWLPQEPQMTTVAEWWDVYRTMRPTWPNALRALDEPLA